MKENDSIIPFGATSSLTSPSSSISPSVLISAVKKQQRLIKNSDEIKNMMRTTLPYKCHSLTCSTLIIQYYTLQLISALKIICKPTDLRQSSWQTWSQYNSHRVLASRTLQAPTFPVEHSAGALVGSQPHASGRCKVAARSASGQVQHATRHCRHNIHNAFFPTCSKFLLFF